MKKSVKERIREELWDFLMVCLSIHHKVKDRKVKTIPEAQQQTLSALTKILKDMECMGLELHTHNSIPSYTADLDEGCSICLKNHLITQFWKEWEGKD